MYIRCVKAGLFNSFFGEQGFVKVLEPSNCSSSSMCNFKIFEGFAGFCCHTRPKHACNVLDKHDILVSSQKIECT